MRQSGIRRGFVIWRRLYNEARARGLSIREAESEADTKYAKLVRHR